MGLYDHDGPARGYNDPGCPPPVLIYGRHTDVRPDPERASAWERVVDWHGTHKCVLTKMGSVYDLDATPGSRHCHSQELVRGHRRRGWCELGHGWVWLHEVRQCLYWEGRGR